MSESEGGAPLQEPTRGPRAARPPPEPGPAGLARLDDRLTLSTDPSVHVEVQGARASELVQGTVQMAKKGSYAECIVVAMRQSSLPRILVPKANI